MKQKGKTWVDAKGKEVPTYAINPVLAVEEKWAHKILEAALKAEKQLQVVMNLTREAYEEVYKAKLSDAKIKGNSENFAGMTINSFDGEIDVQITKPNVMYFDNTISEIIKGKFQEYFDSLSAQNEMAVFLKGLINDLMYTSGGNLDNSKVLTLRKYRSELSENPKLKEKAKPFIDAVDLFDKAIKTKRGSMGVYVRVMMGTGQKRRVSLKNTDL